MKIDRDVSTRIDALRFPLIVGVVFIHNYGTNIRMAHGSIGVLHAGAWFEFVSNFISHGAARVAVPMYFLVAGYLFFLGGLTAQTYLGKVRRRIHTLLIPFLIWNILTLAVYALGQALPATRIYFSGSTRSPVRTFSPFDLLNAIFGLTFPDPISYQFWFIRDLMALVILAPLIYFLLRSKLRLVLLAVLAVLWFSSTWPILWPSSEACLFFCLGATLSWPRVNLMALDRFGPRLSLAFAASLTLTALFPATLYFLKLTIIIGIPTVWWLVSLAVASVPIKNSLQRLADDSFFVFAAHEPLLAVMRKLSYKLLTPASDLIALAIYIRLPAGLIAMLVFVHRLLEKVAPALTALATGYGQRRQIAYDPTLTVSLPVERKPVRGVRSEHADPERSEPESAIR